MPAQFRRLWCACTIIDYLSGTARGKPCRDYIEQIKREPGQHEIVVSLWALAEVVKFDGVDDGEAEKRILEFFGRAYVVRVPFDLLVAEKARYLVRTYKIKPPDAVHMATALVHNVPILETFDDGLINLSDQEGTPPLIIRQPLYDGPQSLFELPSSQAAINPAPGTPGPATP